MLNKLSLLLVLSIALFSCEQKPICDDPNATNYGSETSMCYYNSTVGFYFDESTLEAIKSDIGKDVFQLNFYYTADFDNVYDYTLGIIWVQENYSFDSGHYGIPTDCQSPYYDNFEKISYYEVHDYDFNLANPNGMLADILVTLQYGTPETGNIEEII